MTLTICYHILDLASALIISKIYSAFSNLLVAVVMASSLLGVIILSDPLTCQFLLKSNFQIWKSKIRTNTNVWPLLFSTVFKLICLIFVSAVELICLLFVSVVSFQA